jgi:hypothetical protein
MKIKIYTSPLAKQLLLALGLVILPLLVASHTQAKAFESMPGNPTIAAISMADLKGTNIKNPAALKARVLYLIAHNPKAVRVLAKGYGCSAGVPQDFAGGFWGCLKGCMADVGVSAYSMIMCGVACAAAETGIGAVVCAVCVGVSVTVIEVCALGCGTHGRIAMVESQVRNIKPRRTNSGSLQAKLRRQPARAKA